MRNLFLVFCFVTCQLNALIDLEDSIQDFILETHKIEIPGYPHAFNPGLVRWNGKLLMTFRVIPDPKKPFTSWIGLVWLDENFNPEGPWQRITCGEPCRAEDARLVASGGKLYMVYSDNRDPVISKKGFRVYIAELVFENGVFSLENCDVFTSFEGQDPLRREKNWPPFDYEGSLLFAYSITPHLIFQPLIGEGACETLYSTNCDTCWDYGELRGGTPALAIDNEQYLAFFHSSVSMASVHSFGQTMPHYFMGAYTFSRNPPFEIKAVSPEPIIGKGFYHGPIYERYWGSLRVVFPCGFVFDDDFIYVSYGRQDHELWIAKIDKKKLLDSLVPVIDK